MTTEIQIVPYNPEYKQLWDDFVESSKNGTFLFKRDYMDYHADRFHDNSLLIYRKGKLYSLLPANISGSTLYSHQGLTYGGLIMNEKCTAEGILEVFDSLKLELKSQGIKTFLYKPVPHIYHDLPSEEDLYSLFRNNAKLIIRNVSSTIDLKHLLRPTEGRREAFRRALRNNMRISCTEEFDLFWEILNTNLKIAHNTKPVHSLEEIRKLKNKFPNNIKLWTAHLGQEMVGGILCYISSNVVHTQYISASSKGKKTGAIDFILLELRDKIIPEINSDIKWLDFGTSNEDGGRYLNESLIFQKEGFGGRAICYDTYQIDL